MRLPFDIQMSRVVIPGHMAPPEGQMPDAIKANPCDEGFTFTLGKNGYKYTRYGLERHDA
jgi:CRISPR-associated endonuclease/helicase Cas3